MRKNSYRLSPAARAVVALAALVLATPLTTPAQTRKPAKQTGPAATQAPAGDIKIRTRMTVGEQSFESVEYVRGSRQRTEMGMAGGYKTIMQCDLKRYVQVNDQTRTYTVQPFGDGRAETQAATAEDPPAQGAAKRGGVVTVVSTLQDTGERKEMFGHTARRLKGSTEYQSSPDACQKGGQRMETDGWYIDLKYGVDCPAASGGDEKAMYRVPGCHDEVRLKQAGTAKAGFPVQVTMKIYKEDGSFTATTREVVELSRSPLDPSLFEVPEGYTESNPYAQMSAAAMAGRTNSDGEGGAGDANGARPSSSTNAPERGALGPKKPGVVRIGVVLPRTQMTQGASGVDVATPVRNTLAQQLSGPTVEVAALEASDPREAEEEARRKECDYVLYTGVVQKKGGGGGLGGFLKKAAPVAVGGYGGDGGAAASNVVTAGAHTAADVSGVVKAKDEITLDYRLMPAGGGSTPKAADTLKAKAKHDGEDVLTPLIERAAAAVRSGAAGN